MKRYESLVKQFNVKVALVRTIILYAPERRLKVSIIVSPHSLVPSSLHTLLLSTPS